MNIGIIDADLLGQPNHKFPNLALMKLSAYHKRKGDTVRLISYDDINPRMLVKQNFDKVFLSKVFTNSVVPEYVLKLPFVVWGGTGFYYDLAPNLPDEIEHTFPDYDLYSEWVKNDKKFQSRKHTYYRYYTEFSVGFTTRGCFRQCQFCVNRNERRVYRHSPLSEFVDPKRPKITLLDDNILGCGEHWEDIITQLQATGKPFEFKQGMDIRMLSDKKAELLSKSKYAGDYIFAFDDIADRDVIEHKLEIFRKHLPNSTPKLYVFCAFDRNGIYDDSFWIRDIEDMLERFRILQKHHAVPYLMKYDKYKESPFRDLYVALGSYNAPIIFKKLTIREYLGHRKCIINFAKRHPSIANKYFDMRFTGVGERVQETKNKQVTLFDTQTVKK